MDGVRKKAKYLHDTPNEALMPGVGGNYTHINGNQASGTGQVSLPNTPVSAQQGTFFAQPQPGNFSMYQQPPHGQLPQHMPEGPPISSYNGQQAPLSPTYGQNPSQQTPPLQTIPSSQVSQANVPQMQNFGGPLFDPSDPALFNFDIASLNFGNHYGALEFGMLGHMSSGAADTPPSDSNLLNPLNQAANMYGTQMPAGYTDNNAVQVMAAGMQYGSDGIPSSDWQTSQSRHNSIAQVQTPHNTPMSTNLDNIQRTDTTGLPHAYAIGQGPSSLSTSSPASTGADLSSSFDNGPMSPATFFVNSNNPQPPAHQPQPNYRRQQIQQQHQQQHHHSAQSPAQSRQSVALQPIQSNAMTRKRRRDTNYIYEGIKKPYPYSMSFHRVMGDVATRISKDKQARIGKAMATFRPSFVACSKELDENDLIFSEKNLQRQLLTLEDSIDHLGTPTLVLRRTGEVVALGKEFTILTGWPRDVLLGKEANLNVNWGNSGSANSSGNSSRMTRSPYVLTGKNPDDEDTGPRPVSIVELMDEDSVVQFYEDYATMAFEDSRGSKSRCVNFVKYGTKEDMARVEELGKLEEKNGNGNGVGVKGESMAKTENAIHSEAGMYRLGQKEGMVKCMCVWHIRRDNFDMPMLIVMNVSLRFYLYCISHANLRAQILPWI